MRVSHSSYSAFRRLRALSIGIMTGALLLFPAVRTPLTLALGTILTEQNISKTSDMSEAPQIALGGGRLGATWGERGSNSIDWSATTPTAAWPGPGTKGTGTKVQYQWPDVVMDGAGTLHMLYASGDKVYHRSDPTTGGLSAAHTVASSSFPNPVRLAIAPDGTLWAAWRDTNGSGIFYRRSTDGGLNWNNGSDGGTVASEGGNMFSPDIAVGPDNIPHVVWYIRGSGSIKGEIRIADWNGNSFSKSSVTSDGGDGGCCYDADPAITIGSDNTIHVVWRKQIGSNWAITYADRPAGGSWQNFTPIAVTNGDAKYGPSIGVDTNATLYVIFSSPTGGSRPRKVVLYSKAPGAAWDGPLTLGKGPWDSRTSIVGGSGEAYALYQHEVGTDDGEIYYDRIQFTPPPPPVDFTPVIENGATPTNKATISVSFTGVIGPPDQVRYHWDAAPTDADAWATFQTPISVPRPASVTAEACETHVLYIQVRKGTTTSLVRQAPKTFDIGVQAAVDILNPHLVGLPTFFGLGARDVFTSSGSNGASDGDPNYTRESSFYLGIRGSADCGGLQIYNITGSDRGTITNNSLSRASVLPGSSAPGPHDVSVQVTDALSNTKTYTKTLIYDPANTDTTGVITKANTLGLPRLASGGSVTVDPANSIIRSLSFQGISVTDNLYGKPLLPAGKQFWGVWIANTTSPTKTVDDASLNWYPVRVPTPTSSFTVTWDLFSGLGFTTDLRNRPGDYYFFVRFLDGAGNGSAESLSRVKVTLAAGYNIPTLHLPVQIR